MKEVVLARKGGAWEIGRVKRRKWCLQEGKELGKLGISIVRSGACREGSGPGNEEIHGEEVEE